MSLILASESPFRKELLKRLGAPFQAVAPEVDEPTLQRDYRGSVADLSLFLAECKAISLRRAYPKGTLIGSDQVLIHAGRALSKPKTRDEARSRLQELSGQVHHLSTALFISPPQGEVFRHVVVSRLEMYPLSQQEIEVYLDLDLGVGCAGGYKIEAHGMRLFSRVETEDFYSIIGLPVLALGRWLRSAGFFQTNGQ